MTYMNYMGKASRDGHIPVSGERSGGLLDGSVLPFQFAVFSVYLPGRGAGEGLVCTAIFFCLQIKLARCHTSVASDLR
jgi:hypothetical protein